MSEMKDELVSSSFEVYKNFDSSSINVGNLVFVSLRANENKIDEYASVTTDTSKLHTDEDFASSKGFDGRIVHGAFLIGILSSATARLPGTVVYRSFKTDFINPVPVGDLVTGIVKVVEHVEGSKYKVSLELRREDWVTCIVGESTIIVDPFNREI